MTKHSIQVRHISGNVETITRRLYVDQVGNFNRVACCFCGRTYLVHSSHGDLGDPFRVTQSCFTELFLNSWEPCQWNL
jgi:hypothetical protein